MMQWVLIMVVLWSNAPAVNTQVFYSKETCDLAAAAFEDMKSFSTGGSYRAKCVQRSVDQYGAIHLDRRP